MKGKDTMKAVIGTMAIVLGLSPLLLAAEGGESPTVLYQEALYQEETEGNLDKAIELYGQILEQAADVERLAARATYQLGMCHLKKGDKDTAAVFFRDVVQDYSKQTSVVKKAKVQLDKIAPEGVVRKITLPDADTPDANVVLDLASGELLPAVSGQKQLTLFRDFGKGDLAYDRQLICLRGAKASLIVRDLRGEHTAPLEIMQQIEGVMTEYSLDLVPIPGEYLVTTAEGDDYKVDILSADSNELKLAYTKKTKGGLYDQATQAVWSTIGSLYGQACAKAGMKNLYTNSNIHFVNSDFDSWYGGYGYYTNTTTKPVSGRIQLGRISFSNVKHYDIMGNPLQTDIVPVDNKKGLYQIYLDLPQSLDPGQFYPYAWAVDGSKKPPLVPFEKDKYLLKMENHLGMHGYEVFYLVVPNNMMVDYEEKAVYATAKDGSAIKALIEETTCQVVGNYTIYAWEKEVHPKENHVVTVYLSRANEASPETPAGLRSLSKTYMESGDYDKGVKCYVKWMGLGANGNQTFEALNKLIEEGEPAVEPLIREMKTSYNWQVPKALGAIGDRRAVGALIDKWEQNNTSPMKDVVQESLELITGQQYGDNLDEWKTWWEGVKDTYTPQATISGFMQAALKFDVDKAMSHVAPEIHDYGDIKEIFESPENPFYQMFKKADTSVPIKVTRADISDTMCSAAWEFTLKEDFNFGNKLTLKAGDTFELDGNLRQYGEKWLITGI
ncbi:MAG: tetratricopeptide repeat protein [Planctomycetota bacterium]|jgi:tetratricopeptide (TPR) repeat protein